MRLQYLMESLLRSVTRFLKLSNAWRRFATMASPLLGPLRRVGSGVAGCVIRIARGSVGVAQIGDKA